MDHPKSKTIQPRSQTRWDTLYMPLIYRVTMVVGDMSWVAFSENSVR